MFVKYECGCIGFPPKENGFAIIIKPCDEDGELTFSDRDVRKNKIVMPYTELSEIGVGEFKTQIQRLMYDGYKFRDIKRLLK